MKTNKIIYWTSTSLVSALFLMSGSMYLSKNEEVLKGFEQLGYPLYFVMLLGVAKVLGAIGLLNPWFLRSGSGPMPGLDLP